MTWAITAAIASAFLHACWNMLAKLNSAPRDLLLGIILATASLCGVALLVVGLPAVNAWSWIGAASACNIVYVRAIMEAYARTDFGTAYAMVRAAVAPTLFLMGWAFMDEAGRLGALAGVALVVLSLVLFAVARLDVRRQRLGMLLATSAGGVLALALLFDVIGIRTSGAGIENMIPYAVASSLVTAVGLALVSVLQCTNPLAVLVNHAGLCYAGAALLFCSYLCGMWAYVHGPIGLIAPLRESGIVFGGAFAVLILRESVSRLQWTAMGLAIIGIVLVQLG